MERLWILMQNKYSQTKFFDYASQAQILLNMWKQLKIWGKNKLAKGISYTDNNEYYAVSFLRIVRFCYKNKKENKLTGWDLIIKVNITKHKSVHKNTSNND